MKKTITLFLAMLMCMSMMAALPVAATETETEPENLLNNLVCTNVKFEDGVYAPEEGASAFQISKKISVEPQSTYNISFEMKNTAENAVFISYYNALTSSYEEDANACNQFNRLIRAGSGNGAYFGTAREGDAAKEWRLYQYSMPVPTLNEALYAFGLIFVDKTAEIRNLSLVKTSNYGVGTFNSTCDANVGGWTLGGVGTTYEEEADGNRYLRVNGANHEIEQTNLLVPTDCVLRVSFRMKNSLKGAGTFLAGERHKYPLGETTDAQVAAVDTALTTYPFNFGLAKEGDAVNEWEEYYFDIPVPIAKRRAMTVLNLRFKNAAGDPYLAIDDLNVTVINDKCNFVFNGDFEQGSYDVTMPHPVGSSENGWEFLLNGSNGKDQGGIKEDANGNRYLHIKNLDASNNCTIRNHQGILLTPGRYKLSFKIKLQNPKLGFTISTYNGSALTVQDGYLNTLNTNGNFGLYLPVSASFEDDWETKNVYFSVAEDWKPSLALPSLNVNRKENEYMLDDISLTRDDENNLTFTESRQETGVAHATAGNVIKIETVKGNAVTSLSAAGNTIPVNFHYVSEKETAEKMYMIAALYSVAEDGTKKVESIDVKYGETVIDSVTGGKNANGIINLSASLTKPAALNESSYVSVMVIDAVTLLPVYVQTNLSY